LTYSLKDYASTTAEDLRALQRAAKWSSVFLNVIFVYILISLLSVTADRRRIERDNKQQRGPREWHERPVS